MKKCFLFFLTMLLFAGLHAQLNEFGYPLYKYYNPNDINSTGQNWAIARAPNGILYIANNLSGILEYDGETWRRIAIPGDPEVRSLAISEKGVVYVGCSSEFGYLEATYNGDLYYRNISSSLPDSLNKFSVIYNVNIIDDVVYFSSDKNQLYKYLPEKDSLTVVKTPKYTLFTFDVDNLIYGGSYTEGIFKIFNSELAFVNGGDFYKSTNVFSILDGVPNKLVVTGNEGIFNFDEQKGVSTQLLNKETLKELSDITLYTATQNQSNIFVGSLGSGMLIFDKNGNMRSILNSEIGIQDGICTSVKNIQNTVWTSLQIGLVNVEYANPIRIFGEMSGLNGIINDIVNFEGKLFVGTDIGLYYLHFNGNKIPQFLKVPGIENQVFSLSVLKTEQSNGEILLIGTVEGIYQLNDIHQIVSSVEENLIGIDKIFPTIEKDKLGSVKMYVYELFASKDNNLLWCGTKDRLIGIRYKGNNQWMATPAIYNIGDRILSINEDFDKNIYASFKKGILKVNQSSLEQEIIDSIIGMSADINIRVFKYNNTIVLATTKGLFYYDSEEKQFKKFKGIPDRFVNGELIINRFYQLADSSILIASSKGITNQIDFLKYSKGNYFPDATKFSRVPNVDVEVFLEIGSHFWFSSSNKIYSVDLNSNYELDSNFRCLVRKVVGRDSIYFLGNFVAPNNQGFVLSETQKSNQMPVLKYSQNDLTFHFAAPFFEGDDEIVYSYLLNGFKDTWSKWDKEAKAVFTNLNAGHYTFNVKAKNVFNIESSLGTYSFSVLPPWYRTIVAYFGYFLLALLAVYIIVKLYTRKLKQEKIWLEGVVRERTAEIREQRDEIAEQKQSIEDSILYARRIQRAILPSSELADSILPEYFILFRPRDIVSGDYYWMNKVGTRTIIVAADCTGHGVPGAFMSMLGLSFLNEIVLQENILDAHLILNKLRERIKRTLRQEGKEGEAKDGMDIALVIIDEVEKKLYYAGAYNPAYIFRGNELVELKADRMPIGIYVKEKESFTLNEYDYLPGDTFYISSDGYADQFGGPNKEKLKSKTMKEYLASIQDKNMAEQKELLNKYIEEWMGPDQEQIDDMVLVGVRLK